MSFNKAVIRSIALVAASAAPFAFANSPAQGLSPAAAADLLFQLESLQQEVQQLRGMVEEQEYELKKIKERQKDRYIDLDKRISLIMSTASSQAPQEPVNSSANSTQPSGEVGVAPVAVAPISQSAGVNGSNTELEGGSSEGPLSVVEITEPSDEAKSAYKASYALIREKKFEEAAQAFDDFVLVYPSNTLTGNAHYWLGELKLVLGKPSEALDEFNMVVMKFPNHSKVADATYKLGIVNDQLGNKDEAKAFLQKVVSQFAGTNSATLAAGYLNNME
ncbi:tol-pal system protein YbgF [Marinomonas balearica]|uniref:Cell division coordinator CpoB n=1 Tax=Marinomonas balearica TaxID=491947 RepID=A0A4R6M6A7_9GAMM|nr:tol-pal system protein YbgF [Marinomonas balearica]TDO96908.1 tol-pal system protein YbgF [Marinomonas balearica]